MADKFYFFDVGIANYLARRRPVLGTSEFGKSFEHFILMEIMNYRRYRDPELPIHYWRTSTGLEIDFVIGDPPTAIEVKAGRVHEGDLRGLNAFAEEHSVRHQIVVSLEPMPRNIGKVMVLPWQTFLEELYAGNIVEPIF